jgi:hypothetical protein
LTGPTRTGTPVRWAAVEVPRAAMYPEHCATIRTTRFHDGVWPTAAAIANAAGR